MRVRFLILTTATGLAALGLGVGAYNLASGMIDQAIALSWPAIGAALALTLATPSRAGD